MNRWNSDIDALPIHSGSSHFQFSSASGRLHAMTKRARASASRAFAMDTRSCTILPVAMRVKTFMVAPVETLPSRMCPCAVSSACSFATPYVRSSPRIFENSSAVCTLDMDEDANSAKDVDFANRLFDERSRLKAPILWRNCVTLAATLIS